MNVPSLFMFLHVTTLSLGPQWKYEFSLFCANPGAGVRDVMS